MAMASDIYECDARCSLSEGLTFTCEYFSFDPNLASFFEGLKVALIAVYVSPYLIKPKEMNCHLYEAESCEVRRPCEGCYSGKI